jgi:hypothetical protein
MLRSCFSKLHQKPKGPHFLLTKPIHAVGWFCLHALNFAEFAPLNYWWSQQSISDSKTTWLFCLASQLSLIAIAFFFNPPLGWDFMHFKVPYFFLKALASVCWYFQVQSITASYLPSYHSLTAFCASYWLLITRLSFHQSQISSAELN